MKPCYLFALVAGDLSVREDTFKTMTGRTVTLRIYTRAKDIDRVAWAMESLKRAMKWDEDTFGTSLRLHASYPTSENVPEQAVPSMLQTHHAINSVAGLVALFAK